MELLSQMDGFDAVGQVKMIMATNRLVKSFFFVFLEKSLKISFFLLEKISHLDFLLFYKRNQTKHRPDVLDPALLRPGRLDRKVEIPLPNEAARAEILKIHAAKVAKSGDIDYEAIVKVTLFSLTRSSSLFLLLLFLCSRDRTTPFESVVVVVEKEKEKTHPKKPLKKTRK